MTLDEFENTLLIYGADLEKWPHDCRDDGKMLLLNNRDAERLQQEIRQLDFAIEATVFVQPAGLRHIPTPFSRAQSRRHTRVLGSVYATLLLVTVGVGFGLGYTESRTRAFESTLIGLATGDLMIGGWQ